MSIPERVKELLAHIDGYRRCLAEAGAGLARMERSRDAHRRYLKELTNLLLQQDPDTLTARLNSELALAVRFLTKTEDGSI